MEVEVFIEEAKTDLVSQPEEWQKLVSELGLAGQLSLVAQRGDATDPLRPNPFLLLDVTALRVYETALPEVCPVDSYDKDPIPLIVLGAYQLAVREKWFEKVLIRYSRTDPDSVMIGVTPGKTPQVFLMAKWGLEKIQFEKMKARAIEMWIAKSRLELQKRLSDAKQKIETIEDQAAAFFAGEWVWI